MTPLAIGLVIGLLCGFAGGFMVASWGDGPAALPNQPTGPQNPLP